MAEITRTQNQDIRFIDIENLKVFDFSPLNKEWN